MFADAFYDYLHAIGYTSNYHDYILNSNGPGLDAGIGLKIKICPHVYILPEIYYNIKYEFNKVNEDYTTLRGMTYTSELTNICLSSRVSVAIQL